MSQKSSKSKSKQKTKEKPPKDNKSKKEKSDKGDTKSKKSVQKSQKSLKGSKVGKQSKEDKGSKAGNKLQNSRISKPEQLGSQSDFSIFKPFGSHTPQPKIDESMCPYHNEPNVNFCEVCEQVGCGSCLVYGPHNNQMHRILKIEDAFKSRYLYLNQIVCNDLLARRDKLNEKLDDLNLLGDQLRYVKGGIEKETKIQFNQTFQKLNISAGNKFAILNHQMACLQEDLQAINNLGTEFFELTNVNPENSAVPETNPHKGMVPFLLKARALQEQAQQLISKPIKTSVDVFPYDLPRDVTQRKLVLDKNKGWLDLLKTKDETIWNLLEEKKNIAPNLWQNFEQQAKQEILEWQRLNQKLKEQIQIYSLKCSKCGTNMDQSTINDNCKADEGQSYHYFQ